MIKRVWRYRGGRDGLETLEELLSFLEQTPGLFLSFFSFF
mgnify:CR=1 FL=1